MEGWRAQTQSDVRACEWEGKGQRPPQSFKTNSTEMIERVYFSQLFGASLGGACWARANNVWHRKVICCSPEKEIWKRYGGLSLPSNVEAKNYAMKRTLQWDKNGTNNLPRKASSKSGEGPGNVSQEVLSSSSPLRTECESNKRTSSSIHITEPHFISICSP